MKKPRYQLVIEAAIVLFFAVGSIASVINGFRNVFDRVDVRIWAVVLWIVCISWLVLQLLASTGKIRWVTQDGQVVRLKKLGFKTELYLTGIVLILLVHIFYNFYRHGPFSDEAKMARSKELFNNREPFLHLLILPWQKECSFNGKNYDVGLVLKNRLEEMVRKDSIPLRVFYLSDSTDHRNFNRDSSSLLMLRNHADMVIHGYYSLGECEGGSDKVCYMYQTNFQRIGIETEKPEGGYEMHELHGLEDVRDGTGQESIDYIIHWVGAMSELRNRRFRQAIDLFKRIKDYESNGKILFQISNCYYRLGENGLSREALEKALIADPQLPEANIHMSILFIREGNPDSAVARLNKVDGLHSTNTNVLRDLTIAYRLLGDSTYSNLYARLYIAQVPEIDANLKKLAGFYAEQKEYVKSAAYFERAFRLCSEHADDWNNMGCAYLRLGDTAKAWCYFLEALGKDEESVVALLNMGICSNWGKSYSESMEYLKRAEALGPPDEHLLVALGNTYDALGQSAEAARYFDRALAVSPNNGPLLLRTAEVYLKFGGDKTAGYLGHLVSYYSKDWEKLSSAGNYCASNKSYVLAEAFYTRALPLNPENGDIVFNLAIMSGYQHEKEKALHYLSQAFVLNPSFKDSAKVYDAFEFMRADQSFCVITK